MESKLVIICSVCEKIKTSDSPPIWEKVPRDPTYKLSHSYCPTCYEEAMNEIEDENTN